MNKIKYLLALIVFLATSCEIELKNDDTELPPELTVNALVSTDTILTATVTTATSFKEFTIDEYIDFADYEDKNFNDELVRLTVIPTTQVTATVNGSDVYQLKYNADNLNFQCDYRPKEGDVIKIEAAADGYPTASAQVVVPPAYLHVHLDEKMVFRLVSHKGSDKVLEYVGPDGKTYTYYLKKW